MKKTKKKLAAGFSIPPHANEPVHRAVMAWLEHATPEERRQNLVDAGIIEKSGRLAKPYRSGKARAKGPAASVRAAGRKTPKMHAGLRTAI